jgi:uncharacterized membrane protein YhaH (DUF805 family)
MLKELFTWKGRLGRLRFFLYGLASVLIMVLGFVPIALEEKYPRVPDADPSTGAFLLIATGFGAAIWIGNVTAIRRLHDLNLSGWWLLAGFLPSLFVSSPSSIIQAISVIFWLGEPLYLMFTPGNPGDNRFGPARSKSANADQAASAGSCA